MAETIRCNLYLIDIYIYRQASWSLLVNPTLKYAARGSCQMQHLVLPGAMTTRGQAFCSVSSAWSHSSA